MIDGQTLLAASVGTTLFSVTPSQCRESERAGRGRQEVPRHHASLLIVRHPRGMPASVGSRDRFVSGPLVARFSGTRKLTRLFSPASQFIPTATSTWSVEVLPPASVTSRITSFRPAGSTTSTLTPEPSTQPVTADLHRYPVMGPSRSREPEASSVGSPPGRIFALRYAPR